MNNTKPKVNKRADLHVGILEKGLSARRRSGQIQTRQGRGYASTQGRGKLRLPHRTRSSSARPGADIGQLSAAGLAARRYTECCLGRVGEWLRCDWKLLGSEPPVLPVSWDR